MIPAKKCAVNASRLSHSSTWVYACICINIEYILQLNCWDVSTFCILQGILDTLRAMRVWQFLVQASNCKSQTRSCRMVQTTQSVFPMSRRSLNWTTPLPASASCITLPTYLTLDSANLWNICSQAMVNTNSVEVCLYHQRFHLPAQAASGLIGRVVRNPIILEPTIPLCGYELLKLKPTSYSGLCQGARGCWESQDPDPTANERLCVQPSCRKGRICLLFRPQLPNVPSLQPHSRKLC